MFNTLTLFWTSTTCSTPEAKRGSTAQVDNVDYSETRTMRGLTLMLNVLDGVTQQFFLLTTHLFGPETIFKKALLILGVVLSLVLPLL